MLVDLDATSKALWDSVIGYGPLQWYFDDPAVEEIWVNGRLPPGVGCVPTASEGCGVCQFAGCGACTSS